jgi:F-type H+/Na+-transporting ATPase subunit alpha
MTFIPVVELLEGDLTSYIPTNLVSMTDGQIYLSMPLFNEGFRPAVDVGLSVSRIGSRVQWKAMKLVAKSLRIEFIQFKELLRISKLQTGGQSEEMRDKLQGGKVLQTLLTQPANSPVNQETQIICFYAKNEGLLNGLERDEVSQFQDRVFDFAVKTDPGLIPLLRSKKDLTDEIKLRITKMVQDAINDIKSKRTSDAEEVEVG